ncbi:hypothetical protein EW146_g4343 [Bondarzewia mesenterica]|uniref:FMN hydroxy acid dehydrogenase domain-containing protein n=1 Tax=Bondarzewia mesenterica TaxID=1095465 RepID=A0A4S4LUV2_9AGAM|nr:hypothetical protein EW146_g4343 [Bondarzewia mesenterica]
MSLKHDPDNQIASRPAWSSYMNQVYTRRNPPSIGSYDFERLETRASDVTKDYHAAFNYAFGNAGSSSTTRANRKALDQWCIVPRMLRDASNRSLETTLFGVKYPSPLFVAPVGVQAILHVDAELATARAAAKVGVPFIMSTASSRAPEEVAQAGGSGPRWFQLYWPSSDDVALSLLSRIKKLGFSTLVVTLDTVLLGWRCHDLDTAYLPALHGLGTQVGLSDPVFMARQGLQPRFDHPAFPFDPDALDKLRASGDEKELQAIQIGREWIKEISSGSFKTWDYISFLRKHWDGPIVLKGILCVEDAHNAIDSGVDGIVVSNHGGRQVDGAIPSFVALQRIMQSKRVLGAQNSGRFTVLFDSGIRTGSDILKAIAMGAQGVLVARPYLYGLAISGEQGVEEVLRGLLADMEITMGLSGYRSIEEICGKYEEILYKLDAGLF